MIKSEQFRTTEQFNRIASNMPTITLSTPASTFQTTSYSSVRNVPLSIFISIKGRFAWEKIAVSDTYTPVIFRGTIKYFCIKMLHKLLPDYPEDVIRRSSYYQYRKPIDLYVATPNELKLLNRINAHHAHWAYTRQPFTAADELVRVSDFLPFYEHLRLVHKSTHIPRAPSVGSLRPILPQTQQSTERSLNSVPNMPVPLPSLTPTQATPTTLRPARLLKQNAELLPPSSQFSQYPSTQLQKALSSSSNQLSTPIVSNNISNSTNSVMSNKSVTTPVATSTSQSLIPTKPVLATTSSSSNSLPIVAHTRKRSVTTSEAQVALSTASPSSPVTKSTRVASGWLQINKLYTPYVSSNTSEHHLYKIPVSLLTFYDLLKIPTNEHNTNESKEPLFPFEQTLVTPQEIELINELCLKQNIRPFSIDTKLIDLITFYHHCSANILFAKELPLNEPKLSICKDWLSIVQINGGICRLRNITTLHEQTVPFIGNNLLKNFILSSQCLSTATLTIPTTSELEFLQLILFFSNMSINLRNAKLIDIESVQKEYNVDLILLFNDKFPLNVLNYQHQDNRPTSSQAQPPQSESSAATNTFAESTPPPSPPSPVPASSQTTPTITTTTTNNNNNIFIHPPSQLPLTGGSSSSASSSSNRYQKTITFHGHTMTTYTCSGLGSNAQRECISVRALCNMLYPNSSIIEKLEIQMLRLLRSKNINRFRPQNQQSMKFTRLIDIKDVEKHWNYIEQGMRSLIHDVGEAIVLPEILSPLSDRNLKASTSDKVEDSSEKIEETSSTEVYKDEKRPLELKLQDEKQDLPILESPSKRIRLSRDDEQIKPAQIQSTMVTDGDGNGNNR
ncbi:hypothetical protein I4U23_018807 [Adineta vaga]|nr:hypothetical protein I4U23_018807 [Adineta vaga]